MSAARFFLLVSLSGFLGACGGAALESGAETTAAPAAREPLAQLEALQRDFDASEAQLAAELEPRRGEPPVRPQQKASAAESAEAAPRAEDAMASADDAPKAAPCESGCRALSSMRRSADGICSLTKEEDARCAGARTRFSAAARKVAAVGCACRP